MTAIPPIPPYRVALALPTGNIKESQETITLADLATLLGIGVGPTDTEWVAEPGYGQPQIDVAWNGFTYMQGALPAVPQGQSAWSLFGTFPKVTKAVRQENWLKLLTGAASACICMFRPIVGQVEMLDFCDTLSPTIAGGVGGRPPRAYQLAFEASKVGAGDIIFPRTWIGFTNVTDTQGNAFGRRACTIGLIGDGLGGFQFASVNCPVASNNPGDASQQMLVTGAVQPSGLVAPGASGFWATVKMVPPIPGVAGGQVACYLGTTRVALYTLPAAFPQQSVSSIDVVNAQYFGIQPALIQWPNQDGVTIDPGLLVRDIRFKVTSNLDTGPVLLT